MKSIGRIVLTVLSAFVFASGGMWFLQGINVLPGSFMTGNPQWAINGGIIMIVGAGLFWFANRKKKPV